MTSKKKILVIQKIHKVGMQLLDNNPNYDCIFDCSGELGGTAIPY